MKLKETLYPVLMVVFITAAACASKSQEGNDRHDAHHEAGVWQEMDAFHIIMAETFHPYKDSANLEPVRRRAAELMQEADAWASTKLPDPVDNAEVKAKLQQLKAEAATLAESVKSADDNVIGEHLTQVHNTFHEIQEAWYGH